MECRDNIALEACKPELANATLLAYLIEGATLFLSTDASDTEIGASLEQVSNNQLSPITFYSKKTLLYTKEIGSTIESFQ